MMMTVDAAVVFHESKRSRAMNTVRNWLMPAEKTNARFQKLPESLLRSIRRRSVRVKRTKSLMLQHNEKRKSGKRSDRVLLVKVGGDQYS